MKRDQSGIVASLPQIAGMDEGEARVSAEVSGVECQEVCDTSHLHLGHELGVVDLHPPNTILPYEPVPDDPSALSLGQTSEEGIKGRQAPDGPLRRQTVATALTSSTGTDTPELTSILLDVHHTVPER